MAISTHTIQADYLVVGAGAMGMAFVDTLIAQRDVRVVMVDRYHDPGGHWTLAYSFVRLHQPSTGYGVDSRRMGDDSLDATGWNAGLLELASVGEVCAYFDRVMQGFLASGRVDYRPVTTYLGEGRFRADASGEVFEVASGCRIIDATYQNVTVPAMRAPPYTLADGVHCVAPNSLVTLIEWPEQFTVIGAGKTGIDTCLWLLRQGVAPDRITWIMPRDSWLIDRALTQPDPRFAESITTVLMGQLMAIQHATTMAEMFAQLEACGRLIRLDPNVQPSMYRCATVSQPELEQLRRIKHIVRLGRVERIEQDRLVLEQGEVAASGHRLYVDCSADGLGNRPVRPVFDGRAITLQSVRTCQQVFSAALIALVESTQADDAAKNALCVPIPHPDTAPDFLRTTIADARNERTWSRDLALSEWLAHSRLNWVRDVGPAMPQEPAARAEAIAMRLTVLDAMADKLQVLLDGAAA